MTIPPGSTVGILGGGQLGRMLAIAAANLGYRTHIYAPGTSGPAMEVAARWTHGHYGDADAVRAFANQVDVITYEFENVDVSGIAGLPGVHPNARALEVAQDRVTEKSFVEALGGRPAPFWPVDSLADLAEGLRIVGAPAILKTRRMGYDGKGQARILDPERAAAAWAAVGEAPSVLEAMVGFEAEFSILLARGLEGEIAVWDAATNEHEDGILARSTVPPGGIVARQAAAATDQARRIADALGYVGVLACEFFAAPDGPVFNEMAPRVHNSGHWTIEGAVTSQFENHIRAICGLPLGSTALVGRGAEMRNLIGTQADRWAEILRDDRAHLHLYGKSGARPGRKMGHVTRVL
ncbi:5-(carboxyamino)imidazole ribonucleotide synthase [Sphingomonas nostoxanthinifaciens]|uniref:5-(carboxyamino)imidazole ribonucleotide synthase n=1 Tax=Sphingomonas nostoxanthinifaciens TaxID=2872652 RepID=UPI001CC20B5A|nr:5-(carboxyamino)imidazole ribonucleotide synthase [Sphingomonas nostoxanthinifaciens]UAK26304.1 5-(carboxyamino)imidazole ribonucleotide synthase [Sphingomonas nostoxanthinifaciens]